MFRFFLKKNLCDVWDNLFHTITVNLPLTWLLVLFSVACTVVAGISDVEGVRNLAVLLTVCLCSCVFATLFLAEGENAAKIANYETPAFSRLLRNIVPCLKDGLFFGLCLTGLFFIAFISLPYYYHVWLPADGSPGNLMGLFIMACVFWFLLISVLALQWFLPVRSLMGNNAKKCLKKSYIIFFDNVFFTIGVGFLNLFNIFVMIFSLGILNGPATMAISSTDALRLRLYKYDWYEVNPGLTKEQQRDVPWEDLLAKDRQILGPRKWKSFLFPWKE